MRIVTISEGFTSEDEAESYALRGDVEAVRCPDGVSLVSDDGTPAFTHEDACVLIVDGDDVSAIPEPLFDALYRAKGTSTTTEAPPAPATTEPTGATGDNPPTPATSTGNATAPAPEGTPGGPASPFSEPTAAGAPVTPPAEPAPSAPTGY